AAAGEKPTQMGSIAIENATPMRLQLRRYYGQPSVTYALKDNYSGQPIGANSDTVWSEAEVVAELQPFGAAVVVQRAEEEKLWLCANEGQSAVAEVSVSANAKQRTVTPSDIGFPLKFQLPRDRAAWVFATEFLLNRPRGSVTLDWEDACGVVVIPTRDRAFA